MVTIGMTKLKHPELSLSSLHRLCPFRVMERWSPRWIRPRGDVSTVQLSVKWLWKLKVTWLAQQGSALMLP